MITLPCGCQPAYARCEVAQALYERWKAIGWGTALARFKAHYDEGWKNCDREDIETG